MPPMKRRGIFGSLFEEMTTSCNGSKKRKCMLFVLGISLAFLVDSQDLRNSFFSMPLYTSDAKK